MREKEFNYTKQFHNAELLPSKILNDIVFLTNPSY